LIELSSLTT